MRGRCRAPLKQLQSSSLWKLGEEFQHKGVKVTCALVQDGRYWRVKGYIDRSPDAAMDRIDARNW